jgi:hypothetical protein
MIRITKNRRYFPMTEKDFEGAPQTMEPDGVYQFITVDGVTYYRNIETGEISE